jgi:hypothetical protein
VSATPISDIRDGIRTEKLKSGSSKVNPRLSKVTTGRTEPLKSLLMENHKPSE